MEKLLETGKAKAIGVSNYSVKYLEELLPHCNVIPAVDQIENRKSPTIFVLNDYLTWMLDPYLPQQDIHDFCKSKGILVEAYSPLGSTGSPLFKEDAVQDLAKQYNVSAGTVLISYQGRTYSTSTRP